MSMTNYDSFSIFSPEGVVKPFSYLTKAVEQGSLTLSLTNGTFGLIISQKNLKKVYKITPKSLFTFSGITNDGFEIIDYLINKSINEKVLKDREIDPLLVFEEFCYHSNLRTMMSSRRPFGVSGLLLCICDGLRLALFQNGVKECYAMSVGERAQSANTILEKEFEKSLGEEELIRVGIKALKNAFNEIKKEEVEMWGMNEKDGAFEIDVGKYF
ncbi:Proteasome subunit alpha type-6 [Gurleya vavrai]